MKKRLLTLLGGALLGLFSMNASAQTDVTSTYLVNPSFETGTVGGISSLEGWTLPQLGTDFQNISLGNSSACDGHGFGIATPSAGDKYFFNRKGWSSVATELSQDATLPAGKYYITVDYKGYQKGGTTSKLGFSINNESILSTVPFYSTGSSTTGTFAQTDPWKTLGAWFDVAEDGEVTIKITETLEGGSARADLYLDNVKLYQWDADDDLNYANASPTSPMDVTAKFVTNPYFDTNKDGWTSTTGYQNNSRATNQGGAISGGFWENWDPSAKTSGKMYQTLSGMPDGLYKLTAAVHVNSADAKVSLYIGNKQTAVTSTTASFYSITGVVSGGTAEIGLVLGAGNAANWIGLDNVKLEYLGYDATEALAALSEQIEAAEFTEKHSTASETALQTAITAAQALVTAGSGTKTEIETASSNLATAVANVEASITDYAALNDAIAAASYAVITPSYTALAAAKTTAQGIYDAATTEDCAEAIAAIDAAVKAAKVADYTYVTTDFSYPVTLGDWTKTGDTGDMTGQHWSDDNSHKYLEQSQAAWGKSAWSLSYNQNVKLPAGDYVFKVAGRKSSGNCTLELVVKNGDETLGTVKDFPQGDVGLGINKAGATSFDPDDTEGFAYNGAGRGFQWRYVKFTLGEDATINVAVSASASEVHQWVSFCDATVQTNNEANIAMIAYNIALNDAKNALNADAYKNVVTAAGKEYSDLDDLVNADPGDTKTEIEAATAELKEATQAFKDAAASYDDYYAAKAEAAVTLPYASTDKSAALATALTGTPAIATDAATKAAAIRAAYRAYVESNSVAEGIEGIDWSNLVTNTDFGENLDGWTSSQTGGNLNRNSNESPVDSYDFAYCYYDYYNNSANNQRASQTISQLPVGKYMLSVMARADTNLNGVFIKFGDQQTEVNRIGASGGVFGRGWNIYTVKYSNEAVQDVTIEVYSSSTGGNKGGWFGFTRVRLIKIEDYATMSINATAEWGTFAAPFDVELPTGVEAYTVNGYEGNALTLSEAITGTLPAFTAALVYKEGGLEPVTFSGKATEQLTTANTSHCLVGVFQPTTATAGNYVLMLNGENKAVFGQVIANDEPTIGANRCYLQLSDPEPPTQQLRLYRTGDATAIQSVEQQGETVIYDLTGRRVDAAVKGIYIVGGKKMLVK